MIAPFGSWESPITTDLIVEDGIGFSELRAEADALYWTELHPKEKGRTALVQYRDEEKPLLSDMSIGTRVHEYGGGAFALHRGGVVFSNADAQLYRLDPGGEVTQLTDHPQWRFADGDHPIWVGEKHGDEVENCLVAIREGQVEVVAEGHDFYSSPRLSPDGSTLAYITWDLPNMQWDSSTLWLAKIGEDGKLHQSRFVCGGKEVSVCQVQWSKEGDLHFVSDETGFWNLYRLKGDKIENLCEMEAEFGIPGWVFGQPTYAFLPEGMIGCIYTVKGVDHLGIIDPEKKKLTPVDLALTVMKNLVSYKGRLWFIGSSPTLISSIVSYDPETGKLEVIKQSTKALVGSEWICEGEVLEYPTMDGGVGYAFYYPPKNPHFKGVDGEKPPLIVKSHGGPTHRSNNGLSLGVQYWTSRGYAFVDVNYRGSSGYGRNYVKKLEGKWGIADVEDCISAAKTLVAKGLADPNRLLIRGGSSGGYTTLAALTFHDVFAAGTSYYGISDLVSLYESTHKFESTYTDQLVAPYPEGIDEIRKRSPIHFVEKISAPILLLQGTEDKVVPPNQTTAIYEALKKKGVPVGLLLFEKEGHGFRRAENIARALDAELYFYSKILEIKLPFSFDPPPVEIEGLTPDGI